MPELPEVESVRRTIDRALTGLRIARVEALEDQLVFRDTEFDALRLSLLDSKVERTGRKGKIAWLALDGGAHLYFHLGMSGWVRDLGADDTRRLLNHGRADLDDSSGRPRFLKLLIESESGSRVAWTDGRRLARIWLGGSPEVESRVLKLGPDAWNELPGPESMVGLLAKSSSPIKSWLMDQSKLSGIGNWVADEVLYEAKVAPKRACSSLSKIEIGTIRSSIQSVLKLAIDCDADHNHFPPTWLFHARWGGSRGALELGGKKIVREPVGGRTTAWIPELQK